MKESKKEKIVKIIDKIVIFMISLISVSFMDSFFGNAGVFAAVLITYHLLSEHLK